MIQFSNYDRTIYISLDFRDKMAVGGRMWSDFVIFTTKGISVERIKYDDNYWRNTLLPKLESF